MYVSDPHELAYLPEVKQEIEFAEPRDYHEFFYDDQQGLNLGTTTGDHLGIHTQICRFDSEGNHVYMAKDCPHFNIEDEMGKTIQQGWTVQSNV